MERKLSLSYLSIYLASGIYYAWLFKILIESEIDEIFILKADIESIFLYIFFILPLLISVFGIFSFFKNRKHEIHILLCSIFWVYVSSVEILKEGSMVPNNIFIIFMLTISILYIPFFIFKKAMRSHDI